MAVAQIGEVLMLDLLVKDMQKEREREKKRLVRKI